MDLRDAMSSVKVSQTLGKLITFCLSWKLLTFNDRFRKIIGQTLAHMRKQCNYGRGASGGYWVADRADQGEHGGEEMIENVTDDDIYNSTMMISHNLAVSICPSVISMTWVTYVSSCDTYYYLLKLWETINKRILQVSSLVINDSRQILVNPRCCNGLHCLLEDQHCSAPGKPKLVQCFALFTGSTLTGQFHDGRCIL